MIPGSNILLEAFQCIDTDPIQYIVAGQRTKNAVGQFISDLSATPIDYQASVQAVDRKSYVQLGLDMNKRYYNVYVAADIRDFQHGTTGDRVLYNGKKYDVESNNDWFVIDGWVGLLCVEVLF